MICVAKAGRTVRTMTIEQAIEQYGQYINFCEHQGLVARREELEQMTEWLRELQERRKAPEIVRCGECRHRDPEDKKCDCGHDIIWQLPRDDDWFCADAERRSDGENLPE